MNTKSISSLILLLSVAYNTYSNPPADPKRRAQLTAFVQEVITASHAKLANEQAARPGLTKQYLKRITPDINFKAWGTKAKEAVGSTCASLRSKTNDAVTTMRNKAANLVERHPSILTVPVAAASLALMFAAGHHWKSTPQSK